MALSAELATLLHTIIDHLPWREEVDRMAAHNTVVAEVEKAAETVVSDVEQVEKTPEVPQA